MNLFVRMVVYLTIGVFLLACESDKEEDIKVALNYKQPRQTEYPEANYRYFNQRPVLVQKHHIDLTDFIQKHLYDETDLDENMSGTVMAPVDVQLEVQYKNFTFEHPQIHYESGTSPPFVVSHSSPRTTTVTVPVSVNPNHPSQVVEEEIVDNTTVETTTTHIFLWSDNFTYNTTPTQTQRQTYIDFWDNASNYSWDNISIGNTDNMTWCDNTTMINEITLNFDNVTYEFRGRYCNGLYWTVGRCGWGNEISAFPASVRDCQCRTDGYVVRPLISNKNWGGVGKSCGAPSQTLQVILKRSDGNSL